jgi:hypothetical protein
MEYTTDDLLKIIADCRDAAGFGNPDRDGIEGWAALGDPESVPAYIKSRMMEWISVEDGLPEDGGRFVDVCVTSTENPSYHARMTNVLFDKGEFRIRDCPSWAKVTYWMTVITPPPPTDKGE